MELVINRPRPNLLLQTTCYIMHVLVIRHNWKTPCPYIYTVHNMTLYSTGKEFAAYCYYLYALQSIIEFSSPTTITINIILPHATMQVSQLEETIITITGISMSQSSTFKHQTYWLMPNTFIEALSIIQYIACEHNI